MPSDYKDFSEETFDATDYANVILQVEKPGAFYGMDVSTALSKLTFGIDHLNKQVQEQVCFTAGCFGACMGAGRGISTSDCYGTSQVTTHYEDLLQQVTGLSHLEEVLTNVKEGVSSLNTSFDR